MSLREKIGQLIMVTTNPSEGEANEQKIRGWIKNQHIGGVLFLKSSPFELASRANDYQGESKVPLYIGLDAENGLRFRMDSVVRYPYNMGLGALVVDSLIYRMGREVGQQCRVLGVNLNFAPVVDVNSNPANPVINYRSFGENPQRVAQKSWMMAKGLQDERIMVTAKHFPGHGDTSFDSHLTLPVVKRSYAQLDSVDFLPFAACIDSGINGVMSAHISLPLVDKSGLPATLSPRIMTNILRDSLGFKGLVFSDGMNMKGITKRFDEGDAAVAALKAGVDVIEFILRPEVVVESIVEAINKGFLSEEMIDEKCRKVLQSKGWMGLDRYQASDLSNLTRLLNKGEYQLTSKLLYEKSVTVIQNKNSILPLQRLDTLRIASLSIGKTGETTFSRYLNNYQSIDKYSIGVDADSEEVESILLKLKNYNLVIGGVHGTYLSNRDHFNVKKIHKEVVFRLQKQNKLILAFFSNPYALNEFVGLEGVDAVLVTYSESFLAQSSVAQIIFGALSVESTLPVSINEKYREGDGFVVNRSGRLKYSIPEEEGFDSGLLNSKIDSFANAGIRDTIFPGCQVLVACKGDVIFHKSYGFHTYKKNEPLMNDHLYDWASLTKITGPLPLLMKCVEDSMMELDVPFSNYWSDFKGTDKADFTLREVLAHQARLKPWIAFYYDTIKKNNKLRKKFLRDRPSVGFPDRVSTNLYIQKNYKLKIYDAIAESELLKTKKYTYSGLAFYLFPDILANRMGINYENYLKLHFYQPLGASSVTYNPYRYFVKKDIVPTEEDDLFRKELLQGFVHDEGAAMMGGVSGNAGLFGSANDLAKVMQFYLQKGTYGDFSYLKPSTLVEFTRIQYPENENRRGLGFDKPYIDNDSKPLEDAYPATSVSERSFGHSGFTGIFAWADPENELMFIFMSNRVCPTRENTKLYTSNFRPQLQQAIYDSQHSFKRLSY
jgi:beta-glucosidase-like glycosyl hydrolase/CubicO group peptidase (beta-lactamase class C family)